MTTVTPPSSPEGLQESLSDPKVLNALWEGGPDGLRQYVQGYADEFAKADGGETSADVTAQMQMVLAEWLGEHREHGAAPVDLTPSQIMAGQDSSRKLYNRDAMGAKLDKEPWARDLGAIFRAIRRGDADSQAVRDMRTKMRNAFSSEVPSEGGFLIPEVLRAELLRISLETSIIRPRARVVPMDSLRVPYPAVDDTSHASSVYGGIVGYWTEEAAALTQSAPSFGKITLEAKKLTTYTAVPNELIADSAIAFGTFVNEMFPEALAFFEDDAFINGTGVGEPQGYINAPAAISVNRNTASHVKFQDIAAMYPRMLPQSLGRAMWIASIAVMADLLQLAMPTGDATTTFVAPPLWLSGQQAIGGPPMSILGRPVYFSEKPPTLGTKGDLAFIDPAYYLLGDRQAVSAQQSDQFLFSTDQTAFRLIERVDGRVWQQSAITPKNGGSTLSPVVLLN